MSKTGGPVGNAQRRRSNSLSSTTWNRLRRRIRRHMLAHLADASIRALAAGVRGWRRSFCGRSEAAELRHCNTPCGPRWSAGCWRCSPSARLFRGLPCVATALTQRKVQDHSLPGTCHRTAAACPATTSGAPGRRSHGVRRISPLRLPDLGAEIAALTSTPQSR